MSKIVVNYHMTDTTITLTYQGKIRTVNRGTEMGDEVLKHIRADTLHEIPELIDIAMKISKGDPSKRFEVLDGEVYCKGEPVPDVLSKKIVKFLAEKLPIDIFLKFWENLNLNPLDHSKEMLFGFLENAHFPLTPDGCFIAYKNVNANFTDRHTGKMDNSPGAIVKMRREDVSHDPGHACSTGLHVGSYKFAKNFGGAILLEVKVNPRDVVSVPNDHSQGKCRCCEYTVIGPIESEYKVEVVPKKAPATKLAKQAAREKVVGTLGKVADKKKASGIIPDAKAAAEKYPVPANLENIQIGPYAYKATGVSKEALEKAAKYGYGRVKPSKLPAALKQLEATNVHRKLLTKTKYDYFLEIAGEYYRYKQIRSK